MIMITMFDARCASFSTLGRFAPFAFRRSGLRPSLFDGQGSVSDSIDKRAERASNSPRAARRRKASRASVEHRLLLIALVMAALPGCFSLGRDSPPMEEYVIDGARTTDALVPIPGLDGVAVGIRRLDLAPYLATPAIVVRRGEREIMTSDYHRWAEDPAYGINRAVARHLAASGSFHTVDVAPWPVRSRYDYLIQLHVTRFEGVVAEDAASTVGAAHVLATWEIIRQQDETVLARGESEHREDGWRVGDYADLVALLDLGLVMLARDLAVAVGNLPAAGAGQD
jgi:uncharacterized lipoprotein YmbA